MIFDFADEFSKDLKRLRKKWRSLPNDIEYVKPRIVSLYTQRSDIDLNQYRADFFSTKTATILSSSGDTEVVKMRLDVESLGSNNKVRIVFIAIRNKDEIKFIEIYAKNEKSREDQQRIKRYL
ncbi:MAG: hypothetical protein WCH58_03985 [Candidatus Saccharibacteria bacterium]